MAEGIPVIKNENIECSTCALGKQHRDRFSIYKEKRISGFIELIHSNVCVPMQTRSLSSACYFSIFVNDRSRYSWVYFIWRKCDMFEYFK